MNRYQPVLDFVTAYLAEHEHAPTLREIAEGVGYASSSSAHNAVWALISQGLLTGSPGRALRIGDPSGGGEPSPDSPSSRPRRKRRASASPSARAGADGPGR
jgi:SOS-response transcriptional repressor LexA